MRIPTRRANRVKTPDRSDSAIPSRACRPGCTSPNPRVQRARVNGSTSCALAAHLQVRFPAVTQTDFLTDKKKAKARFGAPSLWELNRA